MWNSNEVFKDIKIFWTVHSRPFIRYQSKNLDLFWIWCCFQFFLHSLVQPNQVIHFFFHNIFIIRIRLLIFQAVNLYFVCFWNIVLDHQCSESVSNKNLALHWRQSSCPGTTLIFLVINCWGISKVITCSPLILRWCLINTPQHLLSLVSKALPNTRSFLSPSHLKVMFFTNMCLPHLFQSHPNS